MKKIYIAILVLLLFIIDRTTKILALKFLTEGLFSYNKIIGLRLFVNKGVAFGINMPKPFSILIASIIIIGLVSLLLKNKDDIFAISLIIIGSFSNILDRIIHVGVIDFITIKYMPIFNLSDAYIVLGLIIIIYDLKSTKRASLEQI